MVDPGDACERFEDIDADVFVDPLGPADGDGSRERPFPSVEQALGGDRRVALAPGQYGSLDLDSQHDGLSLVAACPQRAVFSGDVAVVVNGADDIRLEGFQVRGGEDGALRVFGSSVALVGVNVRSEGIGLLLNASTLYAEDVQIDEAVEGGIVASDCESISLVDVRVEGTRAVDGNQHSGVGIDLLRVGTVSLVRTEVVENRFAGVRLQAVGTATGEDLVVRATRRNPSQEAAYGLLVLSGTEYDGTGGELVDNEGPGVLALELGRAKLRDATLRNNDYGADAANNGAVFLYGVDVVDNRQYGLVARRAQVRTFEGTTVSGSPVGAYVLDGSVWFEHSTLSAENQGVVINKGYLRVDTLTVGPVGSRGVELAQSSHGDVEALTVVGAVEYGVLVDGSELAGNLDVRGVEGIGVQMQAGSVFVGEMAVQEVERAGLAVLDSSWSGTAEVRGVGQAGLVGFGVYGAEGATLEGDLVVEDVQGVGVLLSGAVLSGDVAVRRVGAATATATGFGVAVQEAGALDGHISVEEVSGPGLSVVALGVASGSLVVVDAAFAGLVLEGADAELDLAIEGVRPDAHAGGGVGVFIDDRPHGASSVVLTGSVQGAPLSAVYQRGHDPVSLTDCTLYGGEGVVVGPKTLHGEGLVALDGARPELSDCTVVGGGAGVGVLLDGSGAALSGVQFQDVELSVSQQGCFTDMPGLAGAPSDAEICPEYDRLVLELDFDSYVTETDLKP